jgi:hypothetical protein
MCGKWVLAEDLFKFGMKAGRVTIIDSAALATAGGGLKVSLGMNFLGIPLTLHVLASLLPSWEAGISLLSNSSRCLIFPNVFF